MSTSDSDSEPPVLTAIPRDLSEHVIVLSRTTKRDLPKPRGSFSSSRLVADPRESLSYHCLLNECHRLSTLRLVVMATLLQKPGSSVDHNEVGDIIISSMYDFNRSKDTYFDVDDLESLELPNADFPSLNFVSHEEMIKTGCVRKIGVPFQFSSTCLQRHCWKTGNTDADFIFDVLFSHDGPADLHNTCYLELTVNVAFKAFIKDWGCKDSWDLRHGSKSLDFQLEAIRRSWQEGTKAQPSWDTHISTHNNTD